MKIQHAPSKQTRRGSALVVAVVVSLFVAALALTTMSLTARHQKEGTISAAELNTFYAAEAGLNVAWVDLQGGGDGTLGSVETPETLGGLEWWVEATEVDADVTALLATATDGHRLSRVELIVRDASGEITDFGVFGEEGVVLRSNSLVDSYDSSLGSYASQVSGDHANGNGNAGTNEDISISANAKVYGYAQYGPDVDDGISIAANVTLAGYGAAQNDITLAPVEVPNYPSLGALTVNVGTSRVLGPGNLQYTSLTTRSNSSLTVRGPCNLVISNSATINANSEWIFDATNGPIQVYALNDFDLRSNSTISTTLKDPTQLTLNLSGVHTSAGDSSPKVSFSSNAQFYGTIYAPDISVVIASNFELYGSIKSQWVELSSNSRVHFDESLANGALQAGSGFEILAWRPLTGEMAPTEEAP